MSIIVQVHMIVEHGVNRMVVRSKLFDRYNSDTCCQCVETLS